MQQDRSTRNKVIIGLLIVAFILVPLGYYLYTTFSRYGKTEVELIVVPSDAEVTMNNTVVKPGRLYLEPGEYGVKAKRSGFDSHESKETVGKDKKTILISLPAISDEAQKWIDTHKKEYQDFEAQAGAAAVTEGDEFRKKNPIVDKLPFTSFLYRIGYEIDPSDPSGSSIIVTIDAGSGYRGAALVQIRQLGFDPAELKIKFRNYESPF
jgi:hypothetical protein